MSAGEAPLAPGVRRQHPDDLGSCYAFLQRIRPEYRAKVSQKRVRKTSQNKVGRHTTDRMGLLLVACRDCIGNAEVEPFSEAGIDEGGAP